jgi:hypothetical protein
MVQMDFLTSIPVSGPGIFPRHSFSISLSFTAVAPPVR